MSVSTTTTTTITSSSSSSIGNHGVKRNDPKPSNLEQVIILLLSILFLKLLLR